MDDEPIEPRRRSKWIPITALAAGTVLIAAPLVYLWRVGKPQRVSLRSAAAPPPRRAGALSSASAATSRFTLPAPEVPLAKPSLPPPRPAGGSDWDDDDNWGVPPAPPDPNDNFNASLYTFKAFGAATLIVGSLAFAGIWGLRVYVEADTAAEFGAKMRLAIMQRMPLLAQRMRSALQPPTPVDAHTALVVPTDRPWDSDEAEVRLAAAFDNGGLGAWADAAVREVEAEAQLEMKAREDLEKYGPRKSP
ncbi:hypothetical protein B0H15DRAFT_815230 [Mycena belliarum]|uniref:Transmembrane protein n=1 Tax=Mycena belliarum TaxID=1033014 RepID=A0AAD6XYZ4_9AGAR|nr:hypothetical protein B0H15DRAFT_815230 [Mycena belliae]